MMQKKPGREDFSTTQIFLEEELGKKKDCFMAHYKSLMNNKHYLRYPRDVYLRFVSFL